MLDEVKILDIFAFEDSLIRRANAMVCPSEQDRTEIHNSKRVGETVIELPVHIWLPKAKHWAVALSFMEHMKAFV